MAMKPMRAAKVSKLKIPRRRIGMMPYRMLLMAIHESRRVPVVQI